MFTPKKRRLPDENRNGDMFDPNAQTLLSPDPLQHRPKTESVNQLISLNVGGVTFLTRIATLVKHRDSSLCRYVIDSLGLSEDAIDCSSQGFISTNQNSLNNIPSLFIDRDGNRFRFILDYLRDDDVNLPNDVATCKEVLIEAKYFRLDELTDKVQEKINKLTGETTKSISATQPDVCASQNTEFRPSQISMCSQRTFPSTLSPYNSYLRVFENDNIEESGVFLQTTPIEVLGDYEFDTSADF